MKLMWDFGLESLAQEWANSRVVPKKLNKRFYGYNAGVIILDSNLDTRKYFSGTLMSWFNENKNYKYAPMIEEILKVPTTNTALHYMQMVADDAERVGCGYTLFQSFPMNDVIEKYYICVYQPK
ncbi:cysteine-rich secretory protein 2-like [Lycorma delicatula]|uniref:cysteine-rich secretory protein 2-like n=1 Tax=Lycorma delicatula TaxID=130591 RepID=UPI003F511BF2